MLLQRFPFVRAKVQVPDNLLLARVEKCLLAESMTTSCKMVSSSIAATQIVDHNFP